MKKILFAETSEITDTNFLIKKIDGMSVGAIKLNDEYKLVLNVCPHAHAEICRGKISNLLTSDISDKTVKYEKDEQVLICPWHRWEFNLKTGKSILNEKLKIRIFDYSIESDNLYLIK
jgi:3-phenylpropionate/trans-cinnamate dioxygenase ferredoxin subunit